MRPAYDTGGIADMTSQVVEVVRASCDLGSTPEEVTTKAQTIVIASAFAAFLALSAVATAQHSYIGIFQVATYDTAAAQVFADLCFALALAGRWLYADATKRGANPWPWLLSIAFLGSTGPVAYFLWREWTSEAGHQRET